MLLPELLLPLLRVEFDFTPGYCSDDSDCFDDRNALISITVAIMCGDRIFAFQDGV